MRLFRASRKLRPAFDPLDSSASVARDGWRYNDNRTEILYASEVQSLALLEVVVRPGWDTVDQITVAGIDVPDGSIADLDALEISLPSNWNARPAARDSQVIAAQFLAAVDARSLTDIYGARVPSVISNTDFNVILDPRHKRRYTVASWAVIPFRTLRGATT